MLPYDTAADKTFSLHVCLNNVRAFIRKAVRRWATLPAVALCLCSTLSAAPVDADVVIRGATLYDGRGGEGVRGDLAIKGERIVGVGSFEVKGTPRLLDGSGLVV